MSALQNKILSLFLIAISMSSLSGCAGGTADSGGSNPSEGIGVTNLSLSKQGYSVGLVDVDGDGIADKIVGAPYAVKDSGLGTALIYKGLQSGFSSQPTWYLTGDDNTGFSFVKLDKGSSDTAEKFAVGALNGNGEDVSLSGSVSIYRAGTNRPELIIKLSGEEPLDMFGFSLASGDFNADGKTDIIIGAPFHTPEPSLYQQGAVYVYLGPDFKTKISLRASSTNKGLGWAVASGDINGNGIADILISASGSVLAYYGGQTFNPSINSPDVKITSTSSGFGKAIAVIGDVTADGFGEIAIGAPGATINNNRDTGSVYIIKGGTGNRTINADSDQNSRIVRIDGSALFDRFGSSISPAGDVDDDNIPDFAVGAMTTDVDFNDLRGRVYLFKGKHIDSGTTLAKATAFNGTTRDQRYGFSLANAGNKRLLIGAPTSNMDTGGVSMVDLTTGQEVPGGSSGGSSGDTGECH